MTSGSDRGPTSNIVGTPGSVPRTGEHRTVRREFRWVSWIFGLAMLVVVIIAALHYSEERALVRRTEKAQPWWLAVAIVLQIGTYLAQGECWQVVTRAAKVSMPLGQRSSSALPNSS
jgi:uncharacterized membrane protein YbhN (UPF0104 family)